MATAIKKRLKALEDVALMTMPATPAFVEMINGPRNSQQQAGYDKAILAGLQVITIRTVDCSIPDYGE